MPNSSKISCDAVLESSSRLESDSTAYFSGLGLGLEPRGLDYITEKLHQNPFITV